MFSKMTRSLCALGLVIAATVNQSLAASRRDSVGARVLKGSVLQLVNCQTDLAVAKFVNLKGKRAIYVQTVELGPFSVAVGAGVKIPAGVPANKITMEVFYDSAAREQVRLLFVQGGWKLTEDRIGSFSASPAASSGKVLQKVVLTYELANFVPLFSALLNFHTRISVDAANAEPVSFYIGDIAVNGQSIEKTVLNADPCELAQ